MLLLYGGRYVGVDQGEMMEPTERLIKATEELLGLISANRMMLGHYMGPKHVEKTEKEAKAAIDAVLKAQRSA